MARESSMGKTPAKLAAALLTTAAVVGRDAGDSLTFSRQVKNSGSRRDRVNESGSRTPERKCHSQR